MTKRHLEFRPIRLDQTQYDMLARGLSVWNTQAENHFYSQFEGGREHSSDEVLVITEKFDHRQNRRRSFSDFVQVRDLQAYFERELSSERKVGMLRVIYGDDFASFKEKVLNDHTHSRTTASRMFYKDMTRDGFRLSAVIPYYDVDTSKASYDAHSEYLNSRESRQVSTIDQEDNPQHENRQEPEYERPVDVYSLLNSIRNGY